MWLGEVAALSRLAILHKALGIEVWKKGGDQMGLRELLKTF
jgi:hypothetical protein